MGIPITHIGKSANNTSSSLRKCADNVNASIAGKGPVVGTQKHAEFANQVNGLGNPSLRTEVSYLNGQQVAYGTKGSGRFDVVQYDSQGIPIHAWDFKMGGAVLTESRIRDMQFKSGLDIPIDMVK